MDLQYLTENVKIETLEILNTYWQQQTGQHYPTITKLLDVSDCPPKFRIVVQTENGGIRLMIVDKVLFDNIPT